MFGAKPLGSLPFGATQQSRQLLALSAGVGAFVLAGKPLAFVRHTIMPVAKGTYTFTGYISLRGYGFLAHVGTYALTGSAPLTVVNHGKAIFVTRRSSNSPLVKTRSSDTPLAATRQSSARLSKSRQSERQLGG